MEYSIVRLSDVPEMEHDAAMWFHEKWNIPLAAYLESMDDCLLRRGAVPQWYLAVAGDRIIGGMGVIENDFHDRRDLAPNVCAVNGTRQTMRCTIVPNSGAISSDAVGGHRHAVSSHRSLRFLRALRVGISLRRPRRR